MLTEKELLIVRREKEVEVWTLVPFAKNKLILVPYATEIKDKYWTYGKSIGVHIQGLAPKNLALDGRLFNKPPSKEESDKAFRMFWALQRTTEKKSANLTLQMVDVTIQVSVELPSKRKYSDAFGDGAVKVPILVNEEKIAANTRLVAMDDVALIKLMKAQAKK